MKKYESEMYKYTCRLFCILQCKVLKKLEIYFNE